MPPLISSSASAPSSSSTSGHNTGVCGLPKSTQASLMAALFYASTSVAISMLNKALLSSFNFSCYFFMLSVQLAMTLSFCIVTRDRLGNPFRIPTFDQAVYRSSIPMACAYLANVCIGLLGLQMVNVPIFFAIRRTASAFILLYEYFAIGRVADLNIRGSVGIIVAGALVAGSEALTADLLGYAITALNNLTTAAASVMQKQFSETAKVSGGTGAFTIMYYQSLTALPAAVTLGLITGEINTLATFPHLYSFTFWVGLIAASGMGLLLSYSSLLCTTMNSPLATSITGNAKDVVLTIVGAMVFPGFRATFTSIGGLILSFTGSGLYSYISLRKSLAAAAAATANSSSGGGGGHSSSGSSSTSVPLTPSVLVTPVSMLPAMRSDGNEDEEADNIEMEKASLLLGQEVPSDGIVGGGSSGGGAGSSSGGGGSGSSGGSSESTSQAIFRGNRPTA